MNPSLAYGLTFHCSGFTFAEYAVVYWLGSLTGKLIKCACTFRCLKNEHNTYNKYLISRYDFGCSPVHGPYSQNLCQESAILPEDTFQSAQDRQSRKEETVKVFFS